ncbi:MAG: hypothetical protein KIT61_04180 [Pyrinomonadaceae bacterium]|nr:hypothetical protein [Blastocatellia bacterium]MCW5955758.1 hypothetical protein [Pyrinomonadaceae bacterium]
MSSKTIRVYDYVNHPYDKVRAAIDSDANEVFRNATKVAALRAKSVASELHVNIAGIEVGADIEITVKSIEETQKTVTAPETTRIELEWEAAKMPRLFPFMKAELAIYPLTSTETQLDLRGNYEPPLGIVGSVIDAAVGNRIAEASVHQFISDVAAYLRNELS